MIEEADRLYGLPLEEFVPARDALAKELRAAGRSDDAAAVKGLRKPPAVAWAANQLMRTQRRAADELLAAADRALADPGDRDALRAHAAALQELTAKARGLLSGRGHGLSDDALLRVRNTLHAASLDRDLRDDFAAGRLSAEPPPAGFAALAGMPRPKPAKPVKKAGKAAKPAPPPPPEPKRPSATARRRAERAEARVAKARDALADAERELAEARAALEADQG